MWFISPKLASKIRTKIQKFLASIFISCDNLPQEVPYSVRMENTKTPTEENEMNQNSNTSYMWRSTRRLRATSTRTSYRRKDAIFTNFSSIFSKKIHVVANLHQSRSNLHCTISFFVLFLLYHFTQI